MRAIAFTNSTAAKTSTAWWICALLVLGVVAVYWPLVGYGFVDYDDPEYVSVNPHIVAGLSWPGVVWAFTTFYAANWHPLTWLSYLLDAQLWGSHAGAFHAVNVLFHAANAVLLFLLLRCMTGAQWRSAFVAALFAFHPLHVESVAWISERKDVLSTFFFMLTLLTYAHYAQRRSRVESRESSQTSSGGASVPASRSGSDGGARVPASRLVGSLAPPNQTTTASDAEDGSAALGPRPSTHLALDPRSSTLDYSLALFFFALGLLSKPMLVTVPFVLLLLDFWPLNRIRISDFGFRNVTRLVLEKLPFFALSAASCVVTFVAQKQGEAIVSTNVIPFGERLQNAIVSCWAYVEKMLWPAPLAPFYPYSPVRPDALAVAAVLLLLISVVAFLAPQRRPYLVVGWLWYLGTLVPVIGLVQVGAQALADRYTYIPLIGLFIALTWGVGDVLLGWRYRRAVITVASMAVVGVCLTLTAAQVRYWRDSETLARHALAVTAENEPMQLLLGSALIEQGKIEEAGQHFAEAYRISPASIPALVDLALALDSQGRLDKAVAICREALKLQPRNFKIHYILANALSQQGNFAGAIAECQTTLQLDPNHQLALNDLAWILATAPDASLRNGAEAVRRAERACRLTDYKLPLFVGTLAAAYAEAGRFDDAAKAADQAIALATARGQPALAAKNRELLKLYQAHKAYHQPAADHL